MERTWRFLCHRSCSPSTSQEIFFQLDGPEPFNENNLFPQMMSSFIHHSPCHPIQHSLDLLVPGCQFGTNPPPSVFHVIIFTPLQCSYFFVHPFFLLLLDRSPPNNPSLPGGISFPVLQPVLHVALHLFGGTRVLINSHSIPFL